MARYTITHHTGGPDAEHYDFFLESGAALRTWRILRPLFENPQPALASADHKPKYLDYEGPISGQRGEAKIWDTGTYVSELWKDDRILVAVKGRQLKTRLRLDRAKGDEGKDAGRWEIVDATAPVRRLAAALLRDPGLNAAPTPELEEIGRNLLDEEHSLLSVVQAFAKGDAVAWDLATSSKDLRTRLQSEHSRWRHPWLDAAMTRAARLDEIVKTLRLAKPS